MVGVVVIIHIQLHYSYHFRVELTIQLQLHIQKNELISKPVITRCSRRSYVNG